MANNVAGQRKAEVANKPQMETKLSYFTNQYVGLMERDFSEHGVQFDDYSKQCVMAAMSSVYQLATSNKVDMQAFNGSNLRDVMGQVASLRLNANSVPREVYFSLRKRQNANGDWEQIVELGIEGDGNDALLRQYGQDVERVYPCWLVKEGDDFTYPVHRGIEVEPPVWVQKGMSERVIRVVYPVKLRAGEVEYLIAERESVKTNLMSHVRNNLMNETFGIVTGKKSNGKARTRYDATSEEKKKIAERKEEIYEALRKCESLEDMLSCEMAKPYISAAWLDTSESMIVRKMRNNATKKFPKNLNNMASASLLQLDDMYKATRDEIAENANSEDFPEDDSVIDTEAKEVNEPPATEGEAAKSGNESDDEPDFMKE